jgi:alpha-ketoglutarate-dependent taurine dioxygenase
MSQFRKYLTWALDDTILDFWQAKANRAPIDTHHPAVRTHPVTGLKALNVNPGFVTGFAELKKPESDKILDFFAYHIHSGDDHAVRWKWDVGSVAMWDNRSVTCFIITTVRLTYGLQLHSPPRYPRFIRGPSPGNSDNCFRRET